MSTNRLVTCPYDEAHKVKESRLQVHITKCKRNHLSEKEDKFICPFNASHVLSKPEGTYHLQNCPDRAPIDRKLCQNLDRNNPYKGRTAVPGYNESAPVITEELWDTEINSGGGYAPPMEPPVGAIVEPPPYSKPAERRRLYQELHTLPNERDPKPPQSKPTPDIPREPKQPTEASKVEMLRRQNVEHYQNLGLGRGRIPSRIAANFFPPAADSNHQSPAARSYSSATSSGISQLGLGRGQINRPGDMHANIFDNSDDFPALGFGRGVSNCLRNGGNAPGPR